MCFTTEMLGKRQMSPGIDKAEAGDGWHRSSLLSIPPPPREMPAWDTVI